MADYPWALPHPFLLLGVVVLGTVYTPVLLCRGLAGFVRPGRRRTAGAGLRASALVTGAVALGTYAWGAMHMMVDETMADESCKAAVGRALAGEVDAYDTSFLPLRFGCRVDGVGTFEALVPGYVNPVVLVCTVLTAVLVTLGRRRERGVPAHP